MVIPKRTMRILILIPPTQVAFHYSSSGSDVDSDHEADQFLNGIVDDDGESFDGIDDAMIANRVLMRPRNIMTMFIAVRPAPSFRNSRGICVARPVIFISDNGKILWIQSPDDGVFVKPTSDNLNPRFNVFTGDDDNGKTLAYSAIKYSPAQGDLPERLVLTAPPGIAFNNLSW